MRFPRARKIVFKPFLIVGGKFYISNENGRNRRIRVRQKDKLDGVAKWQGNRLQICERGFDSLRRL